MALTLASTPAAAEELRDLALAWVQGDFRAPLVCVLDATPRQALRRVRLQASSARSARPSVRLHFHDLEAPPGTECSTVTGHAEPNVIGALELVFEGRSRPDTGEVDFRNTLRREGGFSFGVHAGRLRIGPVAGGDEALESIDFAGRSVRISSVPAGSDAARRLASFGGQRQFQLELEMENGPPLRFELVELPAR